MTEVTETSSPAPASTRRGMRGNYQSMILSTLAVLGITVLWLALVPRTSQNNQPPVDVATLATQTERELDWEVSVAEGLPPDWSVTNVRLFETTDGLPTWHVGYRTPSGAYVAIDQTEKPTDEWLEFQTGRGERDGSELVEGVAWDRYHHDSPLRRSLVLEPTSSSALTTVVSGNGDYAELATLAHSLVDFDAKGIAPLPTQTAGSASPSPSR